VETALGAGSTNSRLATTGRDAVLVEDAAQIRVMGQPILEALPSRAAPYEQVDPFLLVHEGRLRLSDLANVDTKHPHRGFDNLWYVLEGAVSTGHSTGPGGAMERARLSRGALLALRTGRGAWHAEAIGADELEDGQAEGEFRGVLFWVNLARKDKQMEPSALVVPPEQIPARQVGDATVRVLGGRGIARSSWDARAHPRSRVADRWRGHHTAAGGVPGLRLRVGRRGRVRCQPAPGEAGPARASRSRRGVHGRQCLNGMRYLLMAGKPYGEAPVFKGPFVD
jgi:redox-sensitive bicupin YhaK (pirin superfamily)